MRSVAQPVCGEFLHVIITLAVQNIPHNGLNRRAIVVFIGMESREDGGLFVKGEGRRSGLVRNAHVEHPGIRAIRLAVSF